MRQRCNGQASDVGSKSQTKKKMVGSNNPKKMDSRETEGGTTFLLRATFGVLSG